MAECVFLSSCLPHICAMPTLRFAFDNSYTRDLQGFYAVCQPAPVPQPELLFLNHGLAESLDLDVTACDAKAQAAIFSGNQLPLNAEPIAQAYAGHQFGRFSPQLGDGRALLIGELIDRQGQRRDIAFKGSGPTPFSRNGDGKAAVGPMLREALISEAMHALGIPTTRTLAVVSTGENVYRQRTLPGAVLTRVAASHIRVGTFELFAARGEYAHVQQLADYTIARHDPALLSEHGQQRYLAFLRAVVQRQAVLVAEWMRVGFIHGVMNTDNMSIAGETIDYGPCAFMEAYDPKAVFSSIDEHGRYAYENQPHIAHWNLARLASTLLPLLADTEQQAVDLATEVIDTFPTHYHQHWLAAMRAKLGLGRHPKDADQIDNELIQDWLDLLHANQVDFTLAWRKLAHAAEGHHSPLRALFADQPALDAWLTRWQARCTTEDSLTKSIRSGNPATLRAQAMCRVNPWLIPRNQRVEEVLAAASDDGDLAPFEQLLHALQQPYEENPLFARFAKPAPEIFTKNYRTYCGT